MEKKQFKNSLKTQMLRMTIVPLAIMTIVIVAVSGSIVKKAITDKIEDELISNAELVGFIFDKYYVGDFRVETNEETGDVDLYKGDEKLNGDDTLMKNLSDVLGIQISIFYNDTRIITTLSDEEGNSAMGTAAAAVVKRDVLEKKESAFYTNVMVYDEKSFAYYKPLLSDDGTAIGMIAVCESGALVNREVIKYVIPVIAVCLIISVFFGFIMVRYNKRIANRIAKIDKYMNALANGEFKSEMPRELMSADDEIKHLATDGKRMAHSLMMLVEYDALTELNNRRFADKKLQEIRLAAVEQGVKYCLCIADIDFFKKVNDTYGHEMGDVVLKAVADKLKAGMVGKGFAARWGGEEFLLIFKDRELDIARRELSMIMDQVRTIYVPDTDRQITMSFGLTALVPGETADEVLNRADANLYEAKETGRNQIICK